MKGSAKKGAPPKAKPASAKPAADRYTTPKGEEKKASPAKPQDSRGTMRKERQSIIHEISSGSGEDSERFERSPKAHADTNIPKM